MDRIDRPRGLIRYASLNSIETGARLKVTPRLLIYSTVLVLLAGLLGIILLGRAPVEANLLRAPGALYPETPDGQLSNLYLLKLLNKTNREIPVELKLEAQDGTITVAGNTNVPPGKLSQTAVVVVLDPDSLASEKTTLVIGVYSGGKRLEQLETVFVGP